MEVQMNDRQAGLGSEREGESALPGPGHPSDDDPASYQGQRGITHQSQCPASAIEGLCTFREREPGGRPHPALDPKKHKTYGCWGEVSLDRCERSAGDTSRDLLVWASSALAWTLLGWPAALSRKDQ